MYSGLAICPIVPEVLVNAISLSGNAEDCFKKGRFRFNSLLLYIFGKSHSEANVLDAARLYLNLSLSLLIKNRTSVFTLDPRYIVFDVFRYELH